MISSAITLKKSTHKCDTIQQQVNKSQLTPIKNAEQEKDGNFVQIILNQLLNDNKRSGDEIDLRVVGNAIESIPCAFMFNRGVLISEK